MLSGCGYSSVGVCTVSCVCTVLLVMVVFGAISELCVVLWARQDVYVEYVVRYGIYMLVDGVRMRWCLRWLCVVCGVGVCLVVVDSSAASGV